MESHYKWLEKNLKSLYERLGIEYHEGVIVAHGDKAYSYKDKWNKAGIHFFHGVAIYLLTYESPFSKEVRQTEFGWVDPSEWVITNYFRFRGLLAPAWNEGTPTQVGYIPINKDNGLASWHMGVQNKAQADYWKNECGMDVAEVFLKPY